METYYGFVRTIEDAILLLEACRSGTVSPLQRKLSSDEMQSSQSGSVYIWDEPRVGMGQWTDGRLWESILRGSVFLSYEMEGRQRKIDGLVRMSFRIATRGQHLHLISYVSSSQDALSKLTRPTHDPRLRDIIIDKSLYYELVRGIAMDKSPHYKFNTSNTDTACARIGTPMAPISQLPYATPHAVDDQHGCSRSPSPAATPPYERHVSHWAPVTPPHCQPYASEVRLQAKSDTENAVSHHRYLTYPRAHESFRGRRVKLAIQSALGGDSSNHPQVDQPTLPGSGPVDDGPVAFPMEANNASSNKSTSVGLAGNCRFYVFNSYAPSAALHYNPTNVKSDSVRDDISVMRSFQIPTAYGPGKGGRSEDARMLGLLRYKLCI